MRAAVDSIVTRRRFCEYLETLAQRREGQACMPACTTAQACFRQRRSGSLGAQHMMGGIGGGCGANTTTNQPDRHDQPNYNRAATCKSATEICSGGGGSGQRSPSGPGGCWMTPWVQSAMDHYASPWCSRNSAERSVCKSCKITICEVTDDKICELW